jgi:hypothetical protein
MANWLSFVVCVLAMTSTPSVVAQERYGTSRSPEELEVRFSIDVKNGRGRQTESPVTPMTLEFQLIPGSITGAPTGERIFSRTIVNGEATVISLKSLVSEIARLASVLSPQGAKTGLNVYPSETRFARIATFAQESAKGKGAITGFRNLETGDDLLLVYFDRPCQLGGISKDRSGRAVEIDATIGNSGFNWLLVTATREGARRVMLAPPMPNVVLVVEH